jgi:hypothetical protein
MHPSIANQDQSIPFSRSYARNPACHSFRNTPAAPHSWKRSCAVDPGQMPVASKAFHWHPVRRRKKMASAHTRSGFRGRPPPKRCGLRCSGSRGWIFSHNSSESRHESAVLVRFTVDLRAHAQDLDHPVIRIGS